MSKVFLKDISLALAKKKGLDTSEADAYLDAFFSVIEEGLSADNVVKIRGLGTFKLVEVRDRESVDVNTGERVVIDGHAKVTFTPENSLKELINKPFSQFETVELNDGVDFDKEINDIDLTASIANDSSIVASSYRDSAEIIAEDEKEGESFLIEKASADTPSVDVGQEQNSESASDTAIGSLEQQQPGDADREEADKDTISEKAYTEKALIEEKAVASIAPVVDLDSANAEMTEEKPDEHTEEAEGDEDTELNECNVSSKPEDTIAADSPIPAAAGKKRHIWLWVVYAIMFLAVVAAIFFAGFYFGEKKDNTALTETYKVSPVAKPNPKKTANASKPAATHSDTAATEAPPMTAAEQNAKDKIRESQEDIREKEREKEETPEPSLANAQTMVRTGAYNIVGTDKSVTVKSGQTMKGIARRYLGEGMECYIQVHNNKSEVKAGETINIPKLQLKKKGRNKKVS